MITVDTPAGFEWNQKNSQWVTNYLSSKASTLLPLIKEMNVNIKDLDEAQFKECCSLLEQTAEGRELRNKMFKAWRSKKSRDSDNGKKLYTFNLSVKAGDQLKQVAKSQPLNQTLEQLIFAGKTKSDDLKKQLQQYKSESKQLKEKVASLTQTQSVTNDEDEIQQLIDKDMQVTELAKLEKSKLIKQILLLKRQLAQQD